jgi:RND family efflux transporter MFP subunit
MQSKRAEPEIMPSEDKTAGALPVRAAPLWHRSIAVVLQLCLPCIVLVAAYFSYQHIMGSAPVAERSERPRSARLVEVMPAKVEDLRPVIDAWGEVVPAETLIVRPEIAGTVVSVHPDLAPGGFLAAGDVAAKFDDADLKLAVAQAEAEIAEIDARISIEDGQQEIGKRELSRLSRNLTDSQRALVLREPQMAQLRAERTAAEATLAQAENALARTVARVPFDAIVVAEDVAPGAMLTQGTVAAELVAADRFHITLSVPPAALARLDPGQTSVQVTQDSAWLPGESRRGEIVRIGAELSEVGRMAEIIVSVPDPMARNPENAGQPQLLLGSFVTARVEGKVVKNAISLDRRHLRDGDTVWVMNAEDKLEIRDVSVVWRGADYVLVKGGLATGDRIIVSSLSSFTEGMALRTREGG